MYNYFLKQSKIDELINSDPIYKGLVDNYIKENKNHYKKLSKAKNIEEKNKLSTFSQSYTDSINALAIYTNKLHRDKIIKFIKSLKITEEDLADMCLEGIIERQTLKDILKFKGIINY